MSKLKENAAVYQPREMITKTPEERDKGNRDRSTEISFTFVDYFHFVI